MLIQKYKAKPIGSDTELIGYITETRKYIGNGCYSDDIEYVISVTDLSMHNSIHRGCFIVEKNSITMIDAIVKSDVQIEIDSLVDKKQNYYAGSQEALKINFTISILEKILNKT